MSRERMSRERTDKVVCVTGAAGYVASWLVKLLLQHGYTVKATVRNPSDGMKVEHLRALDGASDRLQIFEADLLKEGSFDSVVDGCEGVFHTASPVPTTPIIEKKSDVVDPAVKGTINVLKSCAKVASIKRVVVTSSIAAVLYNGKQLTGRTVVDEDWFSDAAFCDLDPKLWYMLSKTLAEEAAWKFAEERGLDLVTINPGYVIGPAIQNTLTSTVQVFLKLIKGKALSAMEEYALVDVRDVAEAHIRTFEIEAARGRHLLVERAVHWSDLCQILNGLYPTLHLSEKNEVDKKASKPCYRVSKEKATSLGINFIPLELSLQDTVESFKQKGFLSSI